MDEFVAGVYSATFKLRKVSTTKDAFYASFEINKALLEYVQKNNEYAGRWILGYLDETWNWLDCTEEEQEVISELRLLWANELRK